ncbi:MAG TPA: NAD(P)/FAD-dependent oxidoreductase [Candidatus Eremiobacteraeota bacterium]|nr:NAD(P)/FAD-dependent oxidoreductase [Candidatus Eremiobacteraeota bacterium]
MEHSLIIIGGGPSGLTAAITAKDRGIDTAIIEGNDRIGKKILITGNGRCNITNRSIDEKRYYSNNPYFVKNILKTFTIEDTTNFFNSLGLPLITLEEGKMYPMSLQASSVVDILRLALKERDITIYCNARVKEIKKNKRGFKLITEDEKIYECKKLIMATGGKSAPGTGSDGSGFTIVKKLGHNIITPVPSLVQLKLNHRRLKSLSGVKFNGTVEIIVEGVMKRKEKGEILFTDYGVSGPPVLQISRIASLALSKGKKVNLKIDMMYNINKEFIENHIGSFSYRSISHSLTGIINKKLIPLILKEAGIDNIHKTCNELTWQEKESLLKLLKEWEFTVIGTNGFKNSQVTAGGVNTEEINENTLRSRVVSDLYFAGEILDVDGDCGGFNLQWAWSSGYVAGKSAAISSL